MNPHHCDAIIKHNSSSSSKSSSLTSSSSSPDNADSLSLPFVLSRRRGPRHVTSTQANPFSLLTSILRSVLPAIQSLLLLPTCRHLLLVGPTPPTSRRKHPLTATGTFFGRRKGRVSFAVQPTPRSDPILLLELATQTGRLAKEMASGALRIVLECETDGRGGALLDERAWAVHCNMRRLGYALSRPCGDSDRRVLGALQAVSVGAGVVPPPPQSGCCEGEVMYMRARFERVIGGRDSEAFYMISLDFGRSGGGSRGSKYGDDGPELSIFLLRI